MTELDDRLYEVKSKQSSSNRIPFLQFWKFHTEVRGFNSAVGFAEALAKSRLGPCKMVRANQNGEIITYREAGHGWLSDETIKVPQIGGMFVEEMRAWDAYNQGYICNNYIHVKIKEKN